MPSPVIDLASKQLPEIYTDVLFTDSRAKCHDMPRCFTKTRIHSPVVKVKDSSFFVLPIVLYGINIHNHEVIFPLHLRKKHTHSF